jgi:hypothetical protein
MSRFVRPETRTLTLANGDQVIVRARLTAGEQRAQYARLYKLGADGRLQLDPFMSGLGIILAYVLDWNLRDDQGQAVVIRDCSTDALQQVIDSLDPASFDELKTAIETHEATMRREREQEKKTDGGTP